MTGWETSKKSFQVGGKVIKHEGLVALMKGSNTFALKRVFDWSTRYYFSDLLEVIERSELALRKTRILAMNPAKWLQT